MRKFSICFRKIVLLAFPAVLVLAAVACNLPQTGSPTGTPGIDPTQPAATEAPTGQATETHETPINTQESSQTPPVETPAGENGVLQIVYIKDGNIWIYSEDASPDQLTDSGDVEQVALSSDGAFVAYTRRISDLVTELWVVGTQGENGRKLTDSPSLKSLYPEYPGVAFNQMEWIPGKNILAFNTRAVLEGPGTLVNDDLHLANIDAQEINTLLPRGAGGMFTFSPDGNQIAVTTPRSISLVNLDGSNRRDVLVYQPVLTYSEFMYYAMPIWKSDSSALLVAIPPADPMGDPSAPTTIWQLPTDGSQPVQISASLMAPHFVGVPVLAPDGSQLAYIKPDPNQGGPMMELHLSAMDGSQDSGIFSGQNIRLLAWSPDSKKFAFAAGEASEFQVGQIDAQVNAFSLPEGEVVQELQWVTAESFIFTASSFGEDKRSLYMGVLGETLVKIDEDQGGWISFDWIN